MCILCNCQRSQRSHALNLIEEARQVMMQGRASSLRHLVQPIQGHKRSRCEKYLASSVHFPERMFTTLWSYVVFLIELFFSKQFIVHRVFGLLYLIQFVLALYWYFADYDFFYNSIIVWSLPLNGLVQSIIATRTFTFLPKKQQDPGYYGDKSTLSYNFIMENVYFAGLLLFQWLYMHDTYRGYLQSVIPVALESSVVFLPYFLYRPLFPKTSFRDSLDKDRNKTDKNRAFFVAVTWITKIFYVWAKHFIGFFLNYARFLDRISPSQIRHIYLMLIWSAAATTISMFLHTLKFKKYIGPKTAYLYYMASYLATFYSWVRIAEVFPLSWDLCLITLTGVVVNFGPQIPQFLYQLLLAGVFNCYRMGLLPQSVSELVFAAQNSFAVTA